MRVTGSRAIALLLVAVLAACGGTAADPITGTRTGSGSGAAPTIAFRTGSPAARTCADSRSRASRRLSTRSRARSSNCGRAGSSRVSPRGEYLTLDTPGFDPNQFDNQGWQRLVPRGR